jgi:hypothetical protein
LAEELSVTVLVKSLRSMGRARAAALLIVLTFTAAVLPLGCGDSTPGCVPGQSIACSRGDCEGHQICASDGKSYGECRCGGTSSDDFPPAGPLSGLIGASCTSSADCREGLDCLTSASRLIRGEGPSAGICLARCVPEHDFCQELDARSKCIVLYDSDTPSEKLDDVAYCLPGCVLGSQPNEEDKCRGRLDLVCAEAPAGSGTGYCRPSCRGDLDCGSRFCNLATGLCADRAATGDEIGAECEPDATAATCAGGCIEHGPSYAECSGVCSYGTPGCGQAGDDAPFDSYCYLDPTGASGAGDLGYCAKACDCDEDCERDDAVCEPLPELEAKTGRAGICGSKTLSSGGARPNIPC